MPEFLNKDDDISAHPIIKKTTLQKHRFGSGTRFPVSDISSQLFTSPYSTNFLLPLRDVAPSSCLIIYVKLREGGEGKAAMNHRIYDLRTPLICRNDLRTPRLGFEPQRSVVKKCAKFILLLIHFLKALDVVNQNMTN